MTTHLAACTLPPSPLPSELKIDLDCLRPDTFQGHSKAFSGPDFWKQSKKEAWERLSHTPLCPPRDERWRLSPFRLEHLNGLGQISGSHTPKISSFDLNYLGPSETEPLPPSAPGWRKETQQALKKELEGQGGWIGTLQEAAQAVPEALAHTLAKNATAQGLGSAGFRALTQAYSQEGIFVYIPDGVKVSRPFCVDYPAPQSGCGFLQTFVCMGKESQLRLWETYGGSATAQRPDAPAPALWVTACFAATLGQGAQLERYVFQSWSPSTYAFHLEESHLGEQARLYTLHVHTGSRYSRFENSVYLEGAQAHAQLRTLNLVQAGQVFDQRSFQSHKAPHTTSDLLYKNALWAHASTIFSGLIQVEPRAQFTDAYQTNRNLLLHPTAQAHSLPGLQIEANPVKCSHGATNSAVDPQALYYLQSRGLPASEAQNLLVSGFFKEILAECTHPSLAAALEHQLETYLGDALKAGS